MAPARRVRILGVDPGSRAAGFGVVDHQGQSTCVVDYGVLRVPTDQPLAMRLRRLYLGLVAIVERHEPDEIAIEEVFSAHNVRSALVLGQARGALLVAAPESCDVFEYSARAVKKAVVGYGQADKAQVGSMVKSLLGLSKRPAQDAADALAIALCHAHSRALHRRVERAIGGKG